MYNNFQTFTDNVGGAYNHFNGFDITVNARLRDVTIQGGSSTGNVVEDECGVAAAHPEIYISGLGWGGSLDFFSPFIPSIGQWPQAFCHRESGWHQLQGAGVLTMPRSTSCSTRHPHPYPGNNPSVASQSLGGHYGVVPRNG